MKILTTLSLLLIGLVAMAQEPQNTDTTGTKSEAEIVIKDGEVYANGELQNNDTTSMDTTRIKLGNTNITIVNNAGMDKDDSDSDKGQGPKYRLSWWNGIDIGVNGILSGNHDFNLSSQSEFLEPEYGKSRYIAFNAGQIKGRIVKDYVGFTMGFSFQFYNYKYSGESDFVFADDSLFTVPSGEKNVTKNKLRATYFAVPAMLEFNTSLNPRRTFHISAGVVGKILIGDMYKQKYSYRGNDNKATLKGDLGFKRWAADAMVRVGYRRLTFFAQTGLLPLFDNANTPDVYTFSAGLFIKV